MINIRWYYLQHGSIWLISLFVLPFTLWSLLLFCFSLVTMGWYSTDVERAVWIIFGTIGRVLSFSSSGSSLFGVIYSCLYRIFIAKRCGTSLFLFHVTTTHQLSAEIEVLTGSCSFFRLFLSRLNEFGHFQVFKITWMHIFYTNNYHFLGSVASSREWFA